MSARRIDVVEEALLVITDLKTKELIKAVEEQQETLQGLAKAVREYADWLQEQIVRIEGEQ